MGVSENSMWSSTHARESDLAAPAVARSCWSPADLLLQTEESERRQSGYTQLGFRQ